MPGGLKKIAPLIIQPRGEYFYLGAVHILRQPPEGGGGVSQKLTNADEGGRGMSQMLTIANKGGCRNGNFSTKGSHVNKNVTKTAEEG